MAVTTVFSGVFPRFLQLKIKHHFDSVIIRYTHGLQPQRASPDATFWSVLRCINQWEEVGRIELHGTVTRRQFKVSDLSIEV